MAVRHEKVVLTLEDHFTTEMARAAAATAALDKNLDRLSGSAVRTRAPIQQTSRDVDGLSKSAARGGAEIDRFSGRLRLMVDAAAVLGPSLVPISAVAIPAITGLASQLGFAAIGMTSLVAASQGVGDALKAVNEASLDPTAENIEKAAEAMRRLGPEAQAFVTRFQGLRPVLGDIRDAAAAGWFPGLTDSLDHLEDIAPRVASIFESIGQAGGSLVADGASALAGPQWAEFLTFVETNAPQALDELGRTVGNVVRGMAELWMALGPLNDDFSSWLLETSRDFAQWADGLSETQGFADFVDYIRESGPQVRDALVAVGDAVLQIVEALAPLGGPSLAIIETFAKAISNLADSDIGTPILAGVAALAIYNRTMQATLALQKGLGLSTATTATGGGIFGMGGTGGNLRKAGSELRTYAALRGQVLARTTADTERMNAALAKSKTGLAGVAKSAGPTALVMGALAASTTETGSSMLSSNAAMLTLMGTMAGPWGAAAGAVVGGFLDIKAAVDQATEALESGDQRLKLNAFEQQRQRYDMSDPMNAVRSPVTFGTEIASKATTGKWQTERLAEGAGWGDAGNMVEQQRITAELADVARKAEAAEMGLSEALTSTAHAAGISNTALAQGVDAITDRTNAALGAFSAETRWREAMKAAAAQARTNGAGIRGNSDAALENRAALDQAAASWNAQSAAVRNNEKRFAAMRRSFIDTAVAMGVPKAEARRLAQQLLDIPESRKTKIALEGIPEAEAALNALARERSAIIRVQTLGKQGIGPERINDGGVANGGTISGQRQPYGDKVLAFVAPGEEVISNRFGQADRHRELLKQINSNRFADGGTVGLANGGTARGGDPFPGLPDSLRALNRALRESEKALEREKAQRDAVTDKMRSLSSDVTGGLRSDVFGADEWSIGSPTDVLRADIARTKAFNQNRAALAAKGLDREALAEILRAEPHRVAEMAAMSKGQLAQYERLYNVRASVTAGAGAASASATYGADLAREMRQVRNELKELRQIKAAIKQEHREDRRQSSKGASKAARRRPRGQMP